MVCSSPPWRGWQGRGEEHPVSYYHRVRRYHLSKGREDPRTCHGRGGSNPTHPKPHHKGERGGGRDRLSPSPLPSSPRGGCGPWALDHSWAKGQLVGPCSILDWSWSSASSRHMRGSSASCAYRQRCACGSRQFDKTRQHSLEMGPTRVSNLALRA